LINIHTFFDGGIKSPTRLFGTTRNLMVYNTKNKRMGFTVTALNLFQSGFPCSDSVTKTDEPRFL